MFTLSLPDTIKWPVAIAIPQDGGKTKKAKMDVEFRYLDQGGIDDLTANTADDLEFLRGVIVDWSGVADEDGDEIPFSDVACGQMLRITYVRAAIMQAFWACITGSAIKN